MSNEAVDEGVDDGMLLPARGAFTLYVIYDHPTDIPDYFVVRPHDIYGQCSTPREVAGCFKELERAREWCMQLGLVNGGRKPADDPKIVEVWM